MRLLIAEDEQRMAAALAKGFGHAGFSVDVVNDGELALRRGLETPYDAILLDIMLPLLSGYEVIRRLRAARVWTPILVVSAKDGEYDEADGLDLGADDYLTKPFSFVVLLAHLRALLRRGATPRPALLSAGDLTLDPEGHTVTRAGEQVQLTAREFEMLEYLIRRPSRVVSKTELLEHVWSGHSAEPNAVEVYAGYLRRKLGRDAVQTVRGVGYRLRP
ncbi:MAG: two-component system, OmpR family, response regulator [Nocardioidaceae bacterium]|nr:two-component system, OmpR family, response regulator [Nocardioidaceae bacterium]